jgi:uncharacterized phage protein gp47/JayE
VSDSSYGLTAAGFVTKPLDVSKSEIEAAFQATFGAQVDLGADGPIGQLIGILAERETGLWELAQAVEAALDPDRAEGSSLIALAALTGTIPLSPTKSKVTLTLTGTNGTVVAAGKQASIPVAGTKFETTASATLASLTAWASSTAYAVGARRSNGGNSYICTANGTSAGSGGPTTTAADITDGTVHWRYIGPGTAAADVAAQSLDYGPKQGLSGTITTIETPVSGWSGVNNLTDAVLGRNEETDASLRLRREQELRAQGNAALDAIRADVLGVDGIISCRVFENISSTTDGDGLPPKSIEVVAHYANDVGSPDATTDDAIRETIFASKAAGIETYGGVTGTVEDAAGVLHTVKFSRPTEKDVWVIVNVTKNADTFPLDGATQIKQALLDYAADRYTIGTDVIQSALYAPVFGVSGVEDVTSILIGLSNPPTLSANLVIGSRELAVLDSSRITVNVT